MGSAGELFDTTGLPEVFFDDIQDLSLHAGVFRCTLYALRKLPGGSEPVMVPVLNLAMPAGSVAPVAGKALDIVGTEAIRGAKEFVRERLQAVGLMH